MTYMYHSSYSTQFYSTMSTVLPSSPSPNLPTNELLQTSQQILRDLAMLNKASYRSLKIACANIFKKLEKLRENLKDKSLEEKEVEPHEEETQYLRVAPLNKPHVNTTSMPPPRAPPLNTTLMSLPQLKQLNPPLKRLNLLKTQPPSSSISTLSLVLSPPLKPLDPQSSMEKVCSPIPPFLPPPKPPHCLSIYGIFDLEDKVNFEERSSDRIN